MPILAIAGIIAIVVGVGAYFSNIGINSHWYYWYPFPFFPLVFIPIIFLFFFGFRWFFWGCWGRSWCYGQYNDPAMSVLRERYAKGEITKEQLERMTRDLEQ